MSERLYTDGVLREFWDDSTSTYTEYDATGAVTSTRPYTADETARAAAEAAQNAQITNLAAQVQLLMDYVFGIKSPSGAAPAWSSTGNYAPGATVTYNGVVYINQTGAWLNGFYVPGDPLHPFWSPQPSTAPIPWVTGGGMPLSVGEYVSDGGHVYRYQGAPQTSAPPNYEPTGTVSTAAWQFIS